jgi:hypothetical protein
MSTFDEAYPIVVQENFGFVEIVQRQDEDNSRFDCVDIKGRAALDKLIADLTTIRARLRED